MENSKSELDEIFDNYSGTPDLARRLDEFMKSKKKLGKPVHVLSYYNGIKSAIKKALESSDPNHVSLHICLKILAQITESPSMGRSISKFIKLGMPKLVMQVFDTTLQFTDIEESPRCAILETLLGIISGTVDFSLEGKNSFKCFVPIGIDLVVDKTKTFQIRTETIKFLNGIVESYGRYGGLSCPVERVLFFQNFETILTWAGDIELQLSMTEFIFRMLSREERKTLATKWFECHPAVMDNFCSIRDEEFEPDCRKFINSLNEKQPENRSVYSLRCQAVHLGTFKVNGPTDDECDGFWTDFNMGSQSVSFFACEDESDSWETVVIKCEYVTEIKLLDKKEDGLIALILILDRRVHTLLSICPETSENYVKLLYYDDNSPVEAANLLFTVPMVPAHSSISPDVVACTPPKASVAINAVHISSRSKGYTKTVPMLTPKRQKKYRVSSDDAKISSGESKASEMDTEGKRGKRDTAGQSANEEDNTSKRDSRNVLEKIDRLAEVLIEDVEADGNARDGEDTKDKSGELGDTVDRMEKVANDVSKDLGVNVDSEVDLVEVGDHMEENGDRKDEEVIDDGECVVEDDVDNRDTKEHEDSFPTGGDSHGSGLDGGREDSGGDRKTKRGKAAKGHTRRSKPPPRKGQAKSSVTSASELEDSVRDMKKRGKKIESDEGIGTRTRSMRSKETDGKKKVGSGYNTEDWNFEEDEIGSQEKKKICQSAMNKGGKPLSQSRLSVIKNVFKETYDEMKNKKPFGPFEFKCSPPSKKSLPPRRTRGGLTLLYSAKRAYEQKKKRELQRKHNRRLERSRRNGGDIDVIPDSLPYMDEDRRMTSSDFTFDINWDEDDKEKEAKTRSRSESELLKMEYRRRGLNDETMKEFLRKLNKESTSEAGEKLVSGMESVGDVERSEKEKENTRMVNAQDEPGDKDDNQFNFEPDPVSLYSEHDEVSDFNGILHDYIADNQDNDATEKEAISGPDQAVTLNFPLGELINECLGIPGDLLNEEDTQDKEGSSGQREIVGECIEREHHGINRDIKDNGGSGQEDEVTRGTAKARGRHGTIGDNENHKDGAGPVYKVSKTFDIGKDHERITGDGQETGEQQDNCEKIMEPLLIISDEEDEDDDDDDDEKKTEKPVTRSSFVSKKREMSTSSSKTNHPKPKTAVEERRGAKIQRRTPTQRRGNGENETSEKGSSSESEEENVVRRSPRLREKKFQEMVEKTLSPEEQDEKCHMSEDDLNVIENFKNNLAKIIGESTCRRSRSKTPSPRSLKKMKTKSSRTQNETAIAKSAEKLNRSKAKTSSKTSRDSRSALEMWENEELLGGIGETKTPESSKTAESSRRESPKRRERFNSNPFEFDARTPKNDHCDKTDSGYFGKTPGSSSRKRILDTRDETPGARGDARDGTPATKFKKPRRFGCLDVMSGAMSGCRKGYRSNEETRSSSFRQKSCSRTTEGTKRKQRDEEIGFVSGPFSVHRARRPNNPSSNCGDEKRSNINISQDYLDVNANFQTPGDDEFVPIEPRKLFQSGNRSAEVNKKKKASKETHREEQEDEDERSAYNDDDSIGDEVRLTLASLGQDMRKTIKKRQNYVNRIANSSMKLITKRSNQFWSRHSSKRKKLISEYASRVDKYIEDHQEVSARKMELEDSMLSQLMKHLETLATRRKEQQKCLQNILKTQKLFTEAFKCLEEYRESEQERLENSLRKEMLGYRDQAIKEVGKQEIDSIKRRIQAMIGAAL